jgi:hypothetical protein
MAVAPEDERSVEVLDAIRRIVQEAEKEEAQVPDLLIRIQSLLPQGGLIEQLIRILLTDHPDYRWVDIRPTIEWALSVRNSAEEILLGMVLRREVTVTNPSDLRLRLSPGPDKVMT